ncbi:hypothetical protein [Microbacterium sp. cf332]|uniref:hypothetical protein n=1 Tax=Microbacterium sp. cf332 TaxID=1761804 RepID=UPI00115F78C3|nr:hypothetical protein [Microbacterium sp. cf332]
MSSTSRASRAAAAAALTVFALVLALIPGMASAAEPTDVSAAPTAATAPVTATASPVPAAVDMSTFNPGNIISDEVFFDRTTMGEVDIQAFLNARGERCSSGHTCLRDYRMNTVTKAADSYCAGYSGAANESAARIIAKVAASCNINPQVLLVTLQKEQRLVTRGDPGPGHYQFAMGQGCPDTAACDSRYYGFQNQVYGAARQFQIYAEGRYFTWYAPGRTWNILYHPNSSLGCGSSPVYIVNKATAGLYYYTPYQPNRAALAAGGGTGDTCSSYGNRNFFRFFTDWFGSTQGAQGNLVRTASAPQIYVVVNGVRRHVQSQEDLSVLTARLGPVAVISDGRMAQLPRGAAMTRLARDARDGRMYLLQADGTKHHFTSASLVTRYGFAMDNYLDLPAAQLDAYSSGAAVGDLFRADDGPEVFKYDAGSRRHIYSQIAWDQERRTLGDYVAVLPRTTVNTFRTAAPLLGAGVLVKETSSPAVYVAGYGDELMHLPSWALASEAGLSARAVVPDTTLRSHRVVGTLAPMLRCGDRTGVVGEGGLNRVTGTFSGSPATVPASICSALTWSSKVVEGPVFIGTNGGSRIYTASTTTLRHVRDADVQRRLADGKPIRVVSWSPDMIATMAAGAPHLSDGSFAQFGDARVFVADGAAIRHVRSLETLRSLAGPGPIVVEQLPSAFLGSYVEKAAID